MRVKLHFKRRALKHLLFVPILCFSLAFVQADMSVSPDSLFATIKLGKIDSSQTITITNNGSSEIEWNIHFEDVEHDPEDDIVQWEFSTCNQSGYAGPSQSDCNNTYGAGVVTVNDGVQYWTVPHSGVYTIDIMGARGGEPTGYTSYDYYGRGARMKGDFELTEGEVLKILVGQYGTGDYYIGGGGGTFVATDDDEPLIVAGGGGGGLKSSNYQFI